MQVSMRRRDGAPRGATKQAPYACGGRPGGTSSVPLLAKRGCTSGGRGGGARQQCVCVSSEDDDMVSDMVVVVVIASFSLPNHGVARSCGTIIAFRRAPNV
jgi:hypothetical protein